MTSEVWLSPANHISSRRSKRVFALFAIPHSVSFNRITKVTVVLIHQELTTSTTCTEKSFYLLSRLSACRWEITKIMWQKYSFSRKEISLGSASCRLISSQLRFSLRIQQQGLCSVTGDHTVTQHKTRDHSWFDNEPSGSSGTIKRTHLWQLTWKKNPIYQLFAAPKWGRWGPYQIKAGALMSM